MDFVPTVGNFPIEDPFQKLQLNFSQLQLGSGMDSSLAAKLAHSQARFFFVGEVEPEEFTDI